MCLLCSTENKLTDTKIKLKDKRVSEEVHEFLNAVKDYTNQAACRYLVARFHQVRAREKKKEQEKKSIDEIILMFLGLVYLGKADGWRYAANNISRRHIPVTFVRKDYTKEAIAHSYVEKYIGKVFNRNTKSSLFILRITTSSKKRETWSFGTLEEAKIKKEEILKTRRLT